MTALGVLGIIAFCAVVIALAAGATFAVVKLLPAKKKPASAAD